MLKMGFSWKHELERFVCPNEIFHIWLESWRKQTDSIKPFIFQTVSFIVQFKHIFIDLARV